MSTTIKNQQAEKDTAPTLSEQRLIEQRCFEIIQGFNDRLQPTSLTDFRTLVFRCMHDAYMLQKGATISEDEVTVMYGLWEILTKIEDLNKLDKHSDLRLMEEKCFEIVQLFNYRNHPVGIGKFRNLIFHCLHDACSMIDDSSIEEEQLATMYFLWQILSEIEDLGLTHDENSRKVPFVDSKEESELQQLRKRVRELELKSRVFLEVIGLVGNGCVDGEKLLAAAQNKILQQTGNEN